MKGSRAAQRYSKAILSLAKDQNATKEVFDDMQQISETLLKNVELSTSLKSPVVTEKQKKSVLKAVFKDAHAITIGAFDLIVDNGRANILQLVARQYITMYNSLNHTQEALVTSAVALTPELEEKIQTKVKELTGASATIKNVIDEEMIGGFVLRVGDLQYDASVAHSLSRLERELKNNAYVSKI